MVWILDFSPSPQAAKWLLLFQLSLWLQAIMLAYKKPLKRIKIVSCINWRSWILSVLHYLHHLQLEQGLQYKILQWSFIHLAWYLWNCVAIPSCLYFLHAGNAHGLKDFQIILLLVFSFCENNWRFLLYSNLAGFTKCLFL